MKRMTEILPEPEEKRGAYTRRLLQLMDQLEILPEPDEAIATYVKQRLGGSGTRGDVGFNRRVLKQAGQPVRPYTELIIEAAQRLYELEQGKEPAKPSGLTVTLTRPQLRFLKKVSCPDANNGSKIAKQVSEKLDSIH